MKRAWTFYCIFALSAILNGCGKNASQTTTQDAGASAASAASSALPQAASDASSASGAQKGGVLASVTKAQLPAEAADTLRLIKAGGPFPFSEDGVLFRNSAGILPPHPRGHYRAYTVRTPGLADRGQRRIVCGGLPKQISDCYYTEDYYVSFKRITE